MGVQPTVGTSVSLPGAARIRETTRRNDSGTLYGESGFWDVIGLLAMNRGDREGL